MESVDRQAFADAVRDVVRLVPAGRATSYGAVACSVGRPTWSRMVGRVIAQTSSDEALPFHRVVSSAGVLSGRCAFGACGRMQALLEAEGVEVHNNRIKNWRQVFWNPLTEI